MVCADYLSGTDFSSSPFYRKLGRSIANCNSLPKADRNEPIDMDILQTFPQERTGEISQHIIKIYKRLHQAKKLSTLSVETDFAPSDLTRRTGCLYQRTAEILVNNLFTQYINNISDRNLRSTNEIFDIPELQPIIEFLKPERG